MGFANFVARRILGLRSGPAGNRLSRPIVLIAVLGIVTGMAVMILTVGISTGFQREVRAKVTGAGAHIEIAPVSQNDTRDSERMPIDQPFYPWLDTVAGVRHIQVFAMKPGIVETEAEIQGVVVKGVGRDHDWSFLKAHLTAGAVPDFPDSGYATTMISRWLASRLQQQVGDTVTIYLVRGAEDIRPRKFRIVGLYETGLEKIDHQLIFTDIGHIQRFARWGLQAEIQVRDTVIGRASMLLVEGLGFGGDGDHTFNWPGTTLHGKGPHLIDVTRLNPKDDRITLVVSDGDNTIPDTAWVRVRPKDLQHVTDSWGTNYPVFTGYDVERGGTGGSYAKYCGGFEVALNDHRDLMAIDDRIYTEFLGPGLRTITVREKFPEIFAWLELLDTNVVVVIVLMVVVAIINMTSALLILILERTNMIGVLKAMGASNGMIRRIFLLDAAYILGTGIVAGDVLGIGLALLQKATGLVRLPIESYYVDVVPIDLSWSAILALNLGTLAVCVLALIIPSAMVSRIAPARAIRFD